MFAPCSVRPLMIFGAVVASRVSMMIVGCSVFSGSLRYGMSVSVPSMVGGSVSCFCCLFCLEICVVQ